MGNVGVGFCLLTLTLAFSSGCAVNKSAQLREALVQDLSTEQKKLFENAISNWFGGIKITLADSVFSTSSTVMIERKAHVDNRGLLIEGRHDNPAFGFTLLTDDEQCVLRNEQNGELASISGVKCTVADI